MLMRFLLSLISLVVILLTFSLSRQMALSVAVFMIGAFIYRRLPVRAFQ